MMIAVFSTGCLFLTIVIRSYAGGLMNYSWKAVPLLAFLFTAGVSGGKIAGGLIGDRIGWMRNAAGSLILALLLFSAASDHPSCGILAVFLFNMTMPVTLTAISELSGPGREGTAFGLTTFALFLGTLPSSVNILTETDLCPSWMLYVSAVLSVLLICTGLAGMKFLKKTGRGTIKWI
jgi:FSR family fosmidomycin resistance protein-like MFS transporter